MKRFLPVLLLALFCGARVWSAPVQIPARAFEGRIAEIHPDARWLSVYSSYGLLFLVLHPEAYLLKRGARVELSAFKPGEDVVAVPGGAHKGDTLLILALEDRKTYRERTGEMQDAYHEAHPVPPVNHQPAEKVPPMQPVPPLKPAEPQPVAPQSAAPVKKVVVVSSKEPPRFLQMDGRVALLDPSDKRFSLRTASGKWVRVHVGERTKIYTYNKDRFTLLAFDKLLVGSWVRVGGFAKGAKDVNAESVLVFPEGVH